MKNAFRTTNGTTRRPVDRQEETRIAIRALADKQQILADQQKEMQKTVLGIKEKQLETKIVCKGLQDGQQEILESVHAHADLTNEQMTELKSDIHNLKTDVEEMRSRMTACNGQ
ncbi:MAG: hypothetical protein Q7R83_03275 [bacterium]|nr:hypothetical protein [bacterium]